MKKRNGFFLLQLDLTDECNLQCVHCYHERRKTENVFSIPDFWESLLQQAVDLGDRLNKHVTIGLSGGEPLLFPKLQQLLDYANCIGSQNSQFSIALMTNGTLFTKEVSQKLNKFFPVLSVIQFSLEGASAPVHEFRRGSNSFNSTIAGIYNAVNLTPMKVVVNCTIAKDNLSEALELVQVCKNLNVNRIDFTRLMQSNKTNKNLARISSAEYRSLRKILYEIEQKLSKKNSSNERLLSINQGRPLAHLVAPDIAIEQYNLGKRNRLGAACSVGHASLSILSDGTVYGCRRLPIPIGHLCRNSLVEIWYNSNMLKKLRKRNLYIVGKCKNCFFFKNYPDICNGGAMCTSYAIYNDINKPDPYCWYQK